MVRMRASFGILMLTQAYHVRSASNCGCCMRARGFHTHIPCVRECVRTLVLERVFVWTSFHEPVRVAAHVRASSARALLRRLEAE